MEILITEMNYLKIDFLLQIMVLAAMKYIFKCLMLIDTIASILYITNKTLKIHKC